MPCASTVTVRVITQAHLIWFESFFMYSLSISSKQPESMNQNVDIDIQHEAKII